MTNAQERAATILALGTVMTISLWVVVVTILVWLKLLDAQHGLGWTLAAAISTTEDANLMFAGIATIIVAGLAAAGALKRPGFFTYATGATIILGLIAALVLRSLMQDDEFAREIRGTTELLNIQAGPAFEAASAAFARNMVIALGAALTALLGLSIRKGQANE